MYVPKKKKKGLPKGVEPKFVDVPEATPEYAESFSNDITLPKKPVGKPAKDKYVKLHKIMEEYKKRK